MKKIIIIFIFCLTFGHSAFATSGACSSHGGVSCASGPDRDGSVICNDGWTDSSVSYASMSMCHTQSSCPTYLPQNDYNSLVNSYNGIIKEAQQKMQASNKSRQSLCISANTQEYRRAQDSYASCMNYKAGLHNLYLQRSGPGTDRSLEVNCGSAPSVSTSSCNDMTSDTDLEYLKIISETQREIACLKVLPVLKSSTAIKSEIAQIADDVRNQTPEQSRKSKEEICKHDKELAKNDPAGFAEYKKNLEILGIPLTDCSTNVTSKKDTSFDNLFEDIPTSTQQVVVSTPTPKPTFWNRIGNVFKKLKFW
jgi:hypothetical protein